MAEAPLSSRNVTVDGVRWHFLEGGARGAPPVVLVHGLSISSAYMAPTGERLAETFRVLAPDLPGFGKSDKPARVLGIDESADALAAWMDAVALPRASFLGNSLGCQVIAALAVRHPGRVERLVLLGPSADPDADEVTLARRLVLDGLREKPSLLLLHARDDLRAGLRRVWRTARAALQDDIYRWAAAVRQPTLILRGQRDPVFPAHVARRLARRMPHAVARTIPGAPHAANYSAPDEVVEACGAFLRGEDPAFAPRPAHAPRRRGRAAA